MYIDMNRNGIWDRRETPTQAWRRLGLLKSGEALSREKYVTCVTQVANALAEYGLFSWETAGRYAREAELQIAPKGGAIRASAACSQIRHVTPTRQLRKLPGSVRRRPRGLDSA